jgi:hypothetical protein
MLHVKCRMRNRKCFRKPNYLKQPPGNNFPGGHSHSSRHLSRICQLDAWYTVVHGCGLEPLSACYGAMYSFIRYIPTSDLHQCINSGFIAESLHFLARGSSHVFPSRAHYSLLCTVISNSDHILMSHKNTKEMTKSSWT